MKIFKTFLFVIFFSSSLFSQMTKAIGDNGKYALFYGGNKVTGYKYDMMTINNTLVWVKINDKWGIIGRMGGPMIEPKFQSLGYFHNRLAKAKINGKWGYIDLLGKFIIQPIYNEARDFSEGFAAVKNGTLWKFIDPQGNPITSPVFDDVYGFIEGRAQVKKNEKWGFINKQGNMAVPAMYNETSWFSEGLAAVKKGNKWGYISKNNNVVIPFEYDKAFSFSDGEAQVHVSRNGKTDYFQIGKDGNKREWIEYNYDYFQNGKLVSKGCHEYLNPFSGQKYIIPFCKPKDECVKCHMSFGQGTVHYIDKLNNEQFILGGKVDNTGKYVNAKLYNGESGELIPMYTTKIENGIITEVIPIENGSTWRKELFTSLGYATLGAMLNDNLSPEEAIGCAINYNVNKIVSSSVASSIINEAVSSHVEKRDFSSQDAMVNAISTEVKNKLKAQTNLNNSDIDNIISFINCLSK